MYTFQAFLLCFISIFHFLIHSATLTLLCNVHLLLYFTNSTVYTYKVFNTYLKLYRRNCDTLHFSLWFAFACKGRPGDQPNQEDQTNITRIAWQTVRRIVK